MLQNLHNFSYSYATSTSSSSSSSQEEEEDYINMEVEDHHHSSFDGSIFNHSSTTTDFEFQQSFSSSSDRDPHATTSPADELFYMGKLLPLHLPPRLEMVHKILRSSAPFDPPEGPGGRLQGGYEDDEPPFATPLFMTPTSTTPFESCNISPLESCEVSRELTSDDYKQYLAECNSNCSTAAAALDEKKSWTRKMKILKQSQTSSSSRGKWTSYIKSLFTKSSGCSSQHSAAAAVSKTKHPIVAKNTTVPFGQIKYDKHVDGLVEDQRGRHRRSFSGAIKHLSKPKFSAIVSSSSSSTSTAIKPNSMNLLALKRSISSSTETESPIQAAIAHCKRSQQSRLIAEEERMGVCRG